MTKLSAAEARQLAAYVYDISGIHLDDSKGYLLETRLAPLLETFQCDSYGDLCHLARADHSGRVNVALIDAISTNETLFFRDRKPFDLLRHKIIPDIIDRQMRERPGGRLRLSVWSAACSTGQELYSIAITLKELLPAAGADEISLLGTDISDEAVSRASYGAYSRFEVARGLPETTLRRYFRPHGDGWRIIDEIRSMAVFTRFNLMDSFDGLGYFDVVFCRNVAIYFTPPDRQRLFEKIVRVLKPGGVLIVGGAESLAMMGDRFQARHYLHGMYYQVGGAGTAAGPERPMPAPMSPPVPAAKPVLRPAPKPAKVAAPTPRIPAPAAAAHRDKDTVVSVEAERPGLVRSPVEDQSSVTEKPPAECAPLSSAENLLAAATSSGDAAGKPSLMGHLRAALPPSGLLNRTAATSAGGNSLLRHLAERRTGRGDELGLIDGPETAADDNDHGGRDDGD